MFPYPSGAGLHVGIRKVTPRPISWRVIIALSDATCCIRWVGTLFGLPAEQYAIRTGQHPRVTTEANIGVFKRQIQALGFSYDWSREIDTTDPRYFKWTQWISLNFTIRGSIYDKQG